MLTAYSRVTVVSGARKVDLALPNALPVSDVVPQVLRYCVPNEGVGRPASWTLARLGGGALSLTQTLAEAGVLDGEVLELRGQTASVRPALVEDVRDALEDSVDSAGGWWTPRTTTSFALLAGAAVLALLAPVQLVRPGLFDADGTSALVCAVTASLSALAFTAWAVRVSAAWVAQICAAVAVAWAFLAGVAVGVVGDLSGPVTLLLASALVALTAGAARAVTSAATPHVAAAAVIALTGVAVAVLGLTGQPTLQVSRIAPVLGLLATGVLPRLTLSVGGIAGADYRVRHVGRLSDAHLVARYRQSNGLLVGGLVGISLVVSWACLRLTFSTDPWDRYLALSLGIVALLRSRVFSRTPHLVPLRVAGVVVLVLQLLRLAVDVSALRPWLVVLLAVSALVLVAVSSVIISEITRARVKRLLNIVEFLVVVDMVVVMLGAVGVYAALGRVL